MVRHGTARHGKRRSARHGSAKPGTARCGNLRRSASRRLYECQPVNRAEQINQAGREVIAYEYPIHRSSATTDDI